MKNTPFVLNLCVVRFRSDDGLLPNLGRLGSGLVDHQEEEKEEAEGDRDDDRDHLTFWILL